MKGDSRIRVLPTNVVKDRTMLNAKKYTKELQAKSAEHPSGSTVWACFSLSVKFALAIIKRCG